MPIVDNARIAPRQDTAANFTSNDPTPAVLELVIETDTGLMKLGDGSTAWTSLSYLPSGVAAGLLSAEYRYKSDVTATDPGSGNVKFDTVTLANIVAMYISQTNGSGNDVAAVLGGLLPGDIFYCQEDSDSTNFVKLRIDAVGTDNGAWWTFTVSVLDSGGSYSNNDSLLVMLLVSSIHYLGDLDDVDLTGAANKDLLVRSGGNWIDTAGKLTWDESTLVVDGAVNITGATIRDYSPSSSLELIKITPADGYIVEESSPVLGAIKIIVPNGWSSTMMNIHIIGRNHASGHEQGTGSNWEFHIAGYPTGSAWALTSASLIGSMETDHTPRVRFGHDGSDTFILIGNVGDTSIGRVHCYIDQVMLYWSGADTNDFETGWDMSMVTSESGMTFTGDDITDLGYLPLAGGKLAGVLDMDGQNITMGGGDVDFETGNIIDLDDFTFYDKGSFGTHEITISTPDGGDDNALFICGARADSASGSYIYVTGNEYSGGVGVVSGEDGNVILSCFANTTDGVIWMQGDATVGHVKSDLPFKIKERAAAIGDTAAYGQIWTKTATPCELWFTDDAGNDGQIFDSANDIKFNDKGGGIHLVATSTPDAGDDDTIFLCGGHTVGGAYGGYIGVYGNEEGTTPGVAEVVAGSTGHAYLDASLNSTGYAHLVSGSSATIRASNAFEMFERTLASLPTATAAWGMLWVKNTTPCELWFRDDAGTNTQIV